MPGAVAVLVVVCCWLCWGVCCFPCLPADDGIITTAYTFTSIVISAGYPYPENVTVKIRLA